MAQWGDRLGIEFFNVEDVLWIILLSTKRQSPRRAGERGSAVGAGGSSPPWRLIVGHLPRGRPRALDPGGGGG